MENEGWDHGHQKCISCPPGSPRSSAVEDAAEIITEAKQFPPAFLIVDKCLNYIFSVL